MPNPNDSVTWSQVLLTVAVPTAGGLITAAITYGKMTSRLDAVEKKAGVIDELKSDMVEVKTDVKWIRDKLK